MLQPGTNGADIELLTTSITQTGSSYYVEWFGEVLNRSAQVRCYIQLNANFQSAAGMSIITLDTYVHAPAHKAGTSSLSAPCLQPGAKGIVWTNDLPGGPIAINSIASMVVQIEATVNASAVIHPATPQLTTLTKTYSATGQRWAISGTATSVADVYNVSIDFYGKAGNFFVDRQTVYHLENLLNAQTWNFDTSPLGLETPLLDDVVPIVDFIEGVKTSASADFAELDAPQAALHRAAAASAAATRERAARAR